MTDGDTPEWDCYLSLGWVVQRPLERKERSNIDRSSHWRRTHGIHSVSYSNLTGLSSAAVSVLFSAGLEGRAGQWRNSREKNWLSSALLQRLVRQGLIEEVTLNADNELGGGVDPSRVVMSKTAASHPFPSCSFFARACRSTPLLVDRSVPPTLTLLCRRNANAGQQTVAPDWLCSTRFFFQLDCGVESTLPTEQERALRLRLV